MRLSSYVHSDRGCLARIAGRTVSAIVSRRGLTVLLAATTLGGLGAGPASAANTDVYLDWGLAADPGWYWVHYLDYVNHGTTNSVGDTTEIEYQTKTGITGTTRDSFEFWGGASVGYASNGGLPNSNGLGFAAPEVGGQWYYNIIDPKVKQGDPAYKILTLSEWLQVNAPNGLLDRGNASILRRRSSV